MTPLFSGPAVGTDGLVRFLFVRMCWSQTARPVDVGQGADGRQLAAAFKSIRLIDDVMGEVARIDPSLTGNGPKHLCYGFGGAEDWGAWSVGGESCLAFALPEGCGSHLRLEIDAAPFTPAFARVDADVLINDRPVGRVTLAGQGPVSIEFQRADVTGLRLDQSPANCSVSSNKIPDVSILILNYNKPVMTLLCVVRILLANIDKKFEIIFLDNGSSASLADEWKSLDLPVRTVRLRANRYFGEGNNIAAEHAKGELLLFLNNDCFIGDWVVDRLCAVLQTDQSVGAVGPVFRYPDGGLQEAGAFIRSDGTAFQRGRLVPDFDLSSLPRVDEVDYVSAACLLVRRDAFEELGGFDLRYDPAYYEDSDLCLRLAATGLRTVVLTDVEAVHVENATTADPSNRAIVSEIIERHRGIFLSRWRDWLVSRAPADLPHLAVMRRDELDQLRVAARTAPVLNAVYTPYPLVPGGGERYILGVGLALSDTGSTVAVTPDECSLGRLALLMSELGYPASRLGVLTEGGLEGRQVRSYVQMGNEALPVREGYGQQRVFHCQFPFPTPLSRHQIEQGQRNLNSFSAVVVNSTFTKGAYLRAIEALGCHAPPVLVIPPPVRLVTNADLTADRAPIILSVGRFSPNGHSKRQDVIIRAFAKAIQGGQLRGWRLVLCGSVANDPVSVAWFEALKLEAANLPVEFVLSPSRRQVDTLMARASVLVSATGSGVRGEDEYWKCEHFGISIVEAASAGCIPVAYEIGGPAEILNRLGAGVTYGPRRKLEDAILRAIEMSQDRDVRHAMSSATSAYSEERFLSSWRELMP